MKQVAVHKRYCQSCGMPFHFGGEDYLGTNPDQTKNSEYCFYCLKDGEYTVDYSMRQMVDVWVKYTDKYNGYAQTNYTPHELEAILKKRLPTLKRWKQVYETNNIHYEIINRITIYISQHLFESLETKTLADIANLSKFHFHRVFKTITGENVGSYIQRLRLEYVAFRIISTNLSLKQILQQTNYHTKHSLAKAFRKHFGMSTTEYRLHFKLADFNQPSIQQTVPEPTIKKIISFPVLFLNLQDIIKQQISYQQAWRILVDYAKRNKLTNKNNKYTSISMDETVITQFDQCRFYIGLTLTEMIKPEKPFGVMPIPEGLYAIFRHIGEYHSLPLLYQAIYQEWFPKSDYRPNGTFTFEMYIKPPSENPASQLITDIYIPVEQIK